VNNCVNHGMKIDGLAKLYLFQLISFLCISLDSCHFHSNYTGTLGKAI
jgi:hypothetical protein